MDQSHAQSEKLATRVSLATQIPRELAEWYRPQWVCWKFKVCDDRRTKVPVNPHTGRNASTSQPNTWGNFTTALRGVRRHRCNGVGFVFTSEDPFAAIDLDHCFDVLSGEIKQQAREVIETLASYVEVSPSGNGLHCFVKGKLPPGKRRKDGVEVYDSGRFFTVTFAHISTTPATIHERQTELEHLVSSLSPVNPRPRLQAACNVDLHDDEVLRRARSATNLERFNRLFAGFWDGQYESQSEADLALCSLFAFWTRDPAQIDRLFRQSGLSREKWERPDYRNRTIALAIESSLGGSCRDRQISVLQERTAKPHKKAWKQLNDSVRRYLLIKDPHLVPIAAALVVANRLQADPVWAFLIAPPGGAKTEIIRAMSRVEGVYPLSTLTPQTLISGYRTKHDPSLLPKLSQHVLTLKDFTTVLTMRPDSRQEILSQLREIYDGSFKKAFGTGKVLEWKGKIGLFAGCTPIIDSHYSIFTVLGERFVMVRIQTPDPIEVSEFLLQNNQVGREEAMREELGDAFAQYLGNVDIPPFKNLHIEPAIATRLSRLASLVVRARSGVVRNSFTRDLEYIPEPEAPTRLTLQLRTLIQALTILDDSFGSREAYRIAYRVGLDCIPQVRRRIIDILRRSTSPSVTTTELARTVGYPTGTVRRSCEELLGLGLLHQEPTSKTKEVHQWRLSDTTVQWLHTADPEGMDQNG